MEKAEKYKQRADISRQIDKRELEYAKSVKAGGNIAARILSGGRIGGKAYQMHMAMNGKEITTGNKVFSAIMALKGGTEFARIRKALVIRSNENTRLGAEGRRIGGITFELADKKKH